MGLLRGSEAAETSATWRGLNVRVREQLWVLLTPRPCMVGGGFGSTEQPSVKCVPPHLCGPVTFSPRDLLWGNVCKDTWYPEYLWTLPLFSLFRPGFPLRSCRRKGRCRLRRPSPLRWRWRSLQWCPCPRPWSPRQV